MSETKVTGRQRIKALAASLAIYFFVPLIGIFMCGTGVDLVILYHFYAIPFLVATGINFFNLESLLMAAPFFIAYVGITIFIVWRGRFGAMGVSLLIPAMALSFLGFLSWVFRNG